MPPPQTPGDVPNVPVNIARPNWQCPHCLTKHGDDLAAATECAEAGPPAPVTEDQPVLILNGRGRTHGPVIFGLTELGPVKPVKVDGAREHRRDVVVAGHRIDADRIADAHTTPGGLTIVTDERRHEPSALIDDAGMSTYNTVPRLFLGEASFGDYRSSPVPVWTPAPSDYSRDRHTWWTTPDEAQRAALNVVTAGLLDKIVDTDEADLAAAIRATYRPGHRNAYRQGLHATDLAAADGGYMLADAHGAPNPIWALRWIATHIDAIVTHQASTLRAWAAGEPAVIPMPSSPSVADSLPKNPGKRRLALMEPFGESYYAVRDTVADQLTTTAPVNPVPDIEDVPTTVRTTREGN